MVEVRLESIEDSSIPRDCYVSVRIGETQKLSRLAASRVYRFPQAGDQRYGKVEIFRRIGACSIDVDPTNQGLREVRISCGDAGFGSLGLKFAVEAEEAAKKVAAEDPSKDADSKKVSSKVKAAKDYLSKHGLEVRLSEAMQAVLRERPDDPAEFLAKMLLNSSVTSCGGIKLPPVSRAQPQPPAPPSGPSMPESRRPQMRPPSPVEAMKAAPSRPLKLEPLQKTAAAADVPVAAAAALRPVSLVPFKAYYEQSFDLASSQSLQRLYGKFAKKTPVAKVGTRLASVAIVPFKAYYQQSFDLASKDALARIHSKFAAYTAALAKAAAASPSKDHSQLGVPMRLKPSVGTWLMPLPKRIAGNKAVATPAVVERAPAEKSGFELLPSVGTWLLRKSAPKAPPPVPFAKKPSVGTWLMPVYAEPEVAVKAPAEVALPASPATWSLKPSVGTWLQRPTPLSKAASASATTPPASSSDTPAWSLKPSVGTWLMRAPVAKKAEAPAPVPFYLRPSVGTWLHHSPQANSVDLTDIKRQAARLLAEAAESGALAKALANVTQTPREDSTSSSKPMMITTSALYGSSMVSFGLRPMIKLL